MGRNNTTGAAGPATSITHRQRRRRRRTITSVVAVAALALTACGGDESASTASDQIPDASSEAPAAGAEPETGGDAEGALSVNDFGRDVITSVGLTMSTSDVDQTARDIRRLTTANGGAVFTSDVTIGDREADGSVQGGGVIVVRIPPEDLDRLVTELDGVGVVSRLSQDAQDVTKQLVDLDIRIRQAESSVERVELLLAEATELGEVLAIETELTERQVALETLRASQRTTEDLVALATLTVNIEYRSPEVLAEGDGIGDAFARGWDAFVGAIFGFGYVLAIGAPFLLTAAAIGMFALWFGRRLTHRQAQRREERRLDADRSGSVAMSARYPTGPTTPPPPTASERLGDIAPPGGTTTVAARATNVVATGVVATNDVAEQVSDEKDTDEG